jgi:hypothetical protein
LRDIQASLECDNVPAEERDVHHQKNKKSTILIQYDVDAMDCLEGMKTRLVLKKRSKAHREEGLSNCQ